jgi:hypothetical protein
MLSKQESRQSERACAIVGELVLTASALDDQLNRICVTLLDLDKATMAPPIVASLDSSKKIEILKAYARTLKKGQTWRKGILDRLEAVEEINRARNIAAHCVMALEGGNAVLRSMAAAKLFKSIDLATKTAKSVQLEFLQDAIKKGQGALGSGANVLENLGRMAAERTRRSNA